MPKNDGSGGYWRDGKWIEITWGDKISEGVKSRPSVEMECKRCGKTYKTTRPDVSKYCSEDCSTKANYHDLEGIKKKAKTMGANILGGRGKQAWMEQFITDAIGSPCPYCGVELTLENVGLDHKEAYRSHRARRYKAESRELREKLDRRENLHLVCKQCNTTKGNLHHDQYVALLAHLATDPDAKEIILKRLRMSMGRFAVRSGNS